MDVGRRGFLLGGGCALVAGCEEPITSRADPVRYRAYEARLRRLLQDTRGQSDGAMAAALLEETNAHRRLAYAAPLRDHPELARAAHAHLADMQAQGYFEHDTPDGFTPGDRAGLICRSLLGGFGENLLLTEGGKPDAAKCVALWRDSPRHNANMLKKDFTHAGHAVLRFGDKTYAAAVFGQVISVMKAPMPFETTGRELGPLLEGSQPRIVDYVVAEPGGGTYKRLYPVSGGGPKLAPGAWRICPLRPQAGQGLQILYGPIFMVA